MLMLTTASYWISGESLDTSAVADVVERGSKGVGSAWVPDARVGAGEVANFAVLCCVSIWIDSALRDWKETMVKP